MIKHGCGRCSLSEQFARLPARIAVRGGLALSLLLVMTGIGQADIWSAARVGDVDAIGQCLADGEKINGQAPLVGSTPAAWAAAHGHADVKEYRKQELNCESK
jgi:hypothetical protein